MGIRLRCQIQGLCSTLTQHSTLMGRGHVLVDLTAGFAQPPVSELLSAIVAGSPESHEHLLVNCIDLRLHFFWIGIAQKISSILQDMFTHTRDFHFFQSARHYLSVFAINVSIEIALTLG